MNGQSSNLCKFTARIIPLLLSYVGVVNESSVYGTLQYELGSVIPTSSFGTSYLLP